MADYSGVCYCCGKNLSKRIPIILKGSKFDVQIEPSYPIWPIGVEQRNWADLPRDVLSVIFKKTTSVDILRSAQYVCRSWRQLSFEPEIWRRIFVPGADMHNIAYDLLAVLAVDRSQGCVEELDLDNFLSEDNELIFHISDRITKLRRLRLIATYTMSETALAQAIRNFPLLEELEISFCSFSYKLVEAIGLACPQLKSFILNEQPYKGPCDYNWNSDWGSDSESDEYIDEVSSDVEAFSIAKHMQQLQSLQLIGNRLTNIGLLAILDSCPNLHCLDIRGCCFVKFDESLRRKCAKIKKFRRPIDSATDFEFRMFLPYVYFQDYNYYNYDPDSDGLDYHDHDHERYSDTSSNDSFYR